LAAKEDQTIFSPDCIPEDFTLSDPDHLPAFKINRLCNHWWGRQRKGLAPFIVLNASPNHGVRSSKKKSEDRKGKGKLKYVGIDDDADEEGPTEEMPPAVKIGPPKRKGKKMPLRTEDSLQVTGPSMVPEDSLLLRPPTPGPSTSPLPKHSPKKRMSKITQPDEIPRPTDRPATRASSKASATKKILTTDKAPTIAKTDRGTKSSGRHAETDMVDKVSKLFEAW